MWHGAREDGNKAHIDSINNIKWTWGSELPCIIHEITFLKVIKGGATHYAPFIPSL
jgi:hypothetical protein